jgi:tryptophan halogenase
MPEPIKNIVIVGGGTAGWMAAASLAKYSQGKNLSVCLIESSQIATVGVGEATVPNIVEFNRNLGIDERELIKATQATFKLGIQFEDWYLKGTRFFHPFADFGLKIDQVDFHQYINRIQAQGSKSNIEDYCFASVLAKMGHFAQPHAQPPSPLADYSYAYHFDASLYAKYLQNFSVNLGVKHIDAKIHHANLHPDSGFIQSVSLQDGREITGDLFIDCSGFQGLLIEKTLHTGYEDWSQWLFCDSAVAMQTERTGDTNPFTRSIAKKAGWQWNIPLQHRSGNGYIYSSKFQTDADAQKMLLANVTGKALNEPRKLSFTPGRRKQIWNKNCFALGLASGFLEPLESTSISLVQTAIAKLLSFFPDSEFTPADIAEVNRLHNREMENIRDFLILHYKLSQRDDSEFWRQCQTMNIPDSLAHKIALYESRGHIVMHDNESFQEASWLSIYHGFNRKSRRYDPRADSVPLAVLEQKLAEMRNNLKAVAKQSMSHQQFIEMHCQALPL